MLLLARLIEDDVGLVGSARLRDLADQVALLVGDLLSPILLGIRPLGEVQARS